MTAAPTATPALPGELGRGTLGRATLAVHRGIVLTLALSLACAPSLVGVLALPDSPFAVGAAVLLATPAAAGWGAVLAGWRRERTVAHAEPWHSFWQAYRRDALDVVRAVLPAVLVLAVIATVLSNRATAGIGVVHGWLLLALAGILALATARVVTLATAFSFRTRDLWRLAVFTLVRRPAATLALLAVLVSAAGLAWWTHEAALLATAALLARLSVHHERPVLALVREDFTHDGQDQRA